MSRKLFIYNDLEFREELPFFGEFRGLLKEDLRPAGHAHFSLSDAQNSFFAGSPKNGFTRSPSVVS